MIKKKKKKKVVINEESVCVSNNLMGPIRLEVPWILQYFWSSVVEANIWVRPSKAIGNKS